MGIRGRGELDILAKKARWALSQEDRETALRAIRDGLRSDKPRVRNAALRLMLAMEKQNQLDDIHGREEAPGKVIIEFADAKPDESETD